MTYFDKNYEQRMHLRNRGRPRTASDELRANNYRNAEGRYELSNGLMFWHKRIVDYMLVNPNAKIKQVALFFRVTPTWLYTLTKTDAFREYYSERMREHQALSSQVIISKMQGVAVKSLDRMAEKLEVSDLPMTSIKEAAELSLKSLGYGVRPSSGVQVNIPGGSQVAVIGVSAEGLARARAKIEERRKNAQDVDREGEGNYSYVTASLDVPQEDVDDAIVVPTGEDEPPSSEEL